MRGSEKVVGEPRPTLARVLARALAVLLVASLVWSDPVSADAPGRPRSVAAAIDDGGIELTWRAPAGNGGQAISGYELWLESGDRTLIERFEVGPSARSARFDPPGLGSYRVRIRASNDDGNGRWVDRNVELTGPPGAPTNLRVVEGDDGYPTVRWAAPSSDGGAEVAGYRVTFDDRSIDVGSARRALRFTNVDRGVHDIEIRARNENGFGPAASISWANLTKPGPPRSVSRVVDGTSVTVSWARPANDGGELAGYDVAIGGAVVSVDPDATVTTLDGLAASDFTVRVRAKNRAGTSDWASGPSISVRKVPGRPRNVEVDVVDYQLRVTWTRPADDGNSPITGYRVRFGGIDEIVSGTTFRRDDVASTTDDVEISAINAVGEGSVAATGLISIARVFEPFDTSGDFVGQVYADFLGRSPDASGRAFWEGRLDSADDMAPMVVSVTRSPELDPERRVARLYLALFDRAPDRAGFDYWVGEYERGRSLPSIAEQFVHSPEFLERFGALGNPEFVVLVYNRVLARQPDQAGFSHWVAQLDAGVGRGELVSLFAEAPEFVAKSKPAVDLIVIYHGLLQRPPHQAELVSGLAVYADRRSLEPVIDRILADSEFQARIN